MSAPGQRREGREVRGRLAVRFARDPRTGETRAEVLERRPPLAVVRAFAAPDGTSLVHTHNVSGGVLGGDTLETSVEVGPGARAQLTTVGATLAYRSADGREATQSVSIRVGPDALVEYLPDPLIPFAGAVYTQSTTVDLDDRAGLFWWEVVAPGRVARGERFAFTRVDLRSEIRAAGRPVAVERFALDPRAADVDSPARLGGYDYFGTFFACRVGLDPARWAALERRLGDLAAEIERPGDALFGCSTLPAHGVAVRALARTRRAIADAFSRFWGAAKHDLYGAEAIAPRKSR
jgi:urease accessory protein